MGTLIAMAYHSKLFANQADHTYVKCGTGKKAWGCWGGKTGGKEIRRGTGSTKRANSIAQPNERAGIKCYLVNGVCHQAANRILLPAGVLVTNARGYSISESLFGPYGRVGHWPCKAPFKKYENVTGDLPACVEKKSAKAARLAMSTSAALTAADKLEFNYIKGVLKIYGDAEQMMKQKSIGPGDAEDFHLTLFMHMAEFNLGSLLDRRLTTRLKQVRRKIERVRVKVETAFAEDEMPAREFVEDFNKTTLAFQDEMANAMTPAQYKTLFGLNPAERVILADQRIIKGIFDID